jgi:hypothetical protein
VTASAASTLFDFKLTHVPRVQRQYTGQDVDAVGRNERHHDVAENLVAEERADVDVAALAFELVLDAFNAFDSQKHWLISSCAMETAVVVRYGAWSLV